MKGISPSPLSAASPDSTILNSSILSSEIINTNSLIDLFLRFALNFLVILIIVRVLYYTSTRRKDYFFTYILISSTIFLLCFMLSSVKMGIGFALGLFAIFGIIRYRTLSVPIREMTYLFVVIGITVINAMSTSKVSLAELLLCNGLIIGIIWALEKPWFLKHESSKLVIYEKIDLIKKENYELLLADLRERTGLEIHRAEVGKINFLRDTAEVIIYYYNGMTNVSTEDAYNETSDID